MLETGTFSSAADIPPAAYPAVPVRPTRRTPSTHRTTESLPPQAECRLAGMLLNGVWHEALAALDRRLFVADWLGRAYAGIIALRQQGKPAVDYILDDTLPAGELAALRQLAADEHSTDAALLAHCARRIQKDALERQLQAAAAAADLAACKRLIDQIDQTAADPERLICRTLSEIQARPIEWLWRPFIARRSITLIAGDSDVGKSKANRAIDAAITTGAAFPLSDQAPARPGKVILLAAEEDAATVLKPALLAAGADVSRVILVESSAEYDRQGCMRRRAITLQQDVAKLRPVLEQHPDATVIEIDPITSYLGDKDSNSTTVVRAVMAELQRLAEDFNIAIILHSHFGKAADRNAKALILGSTAFVAGPRQVITVMRDPQDPTRERRYFIPTKCNNVPESDRTGLAFVIKGVDVADGAVSIPNVGRVEWLAERVTLTADDVLRLTRQQEQEARHGNSGNSEPSIARQAVLKALREAGVPLTSRRMAEAVYGEELPDFKDTKRVSIRRLLGKMLRDRQIEQLADRTYTLPPADRGNSGNSGNSGNRTHDSGKESVTAVTCYRYVAPITGGNSRGNSDEALPVTPLPTVTVTLGNGQLSGNDQHGDPDTTGTAGTTGTTGTAATGVTAVGDDAPQDRTATEVRFPRVNPSPLDGYRDVLLAEAELAADLPSRRSEPSDTPRPRSVATAYWWILTDGSRIGRRFAEPVPLTVATATGRKLYRDVFSHAEPQEIPL